MQINGLKNVKKYNLEATDAKNKNRLPSWNVLKSAELPHQDKKDRANEAWK